MTRYFFHIRDGETLESDPEGTEFSTLEDAVEDTFRAAREILAEMVLKGKLIDGQRFEITIMDGVIVREVPFKDAMLLE